MKSKIIFQKVYLKDCISTRFEQKTLPTPELMDWRESIRIELDRVISVLRKVSYKNINIFCQRSVLKQALSELHKYFLVPVDRATGNADINCRRFSASTLIREVTLGKDTRNDT